MAKFAILNDANELEEKRYDTEDEANQVANGMVSDDPGTTATVVRLLREYFSEMKVKVNEFE